MKQTAGARGYLLFCFAPLPPPSLLCIQAWTLQFPVSVSWGLGRDSESAETRDTGNPDPVYSERREGTHLHTVIPFLGPGEQRVAELRTSMSAKGG